MDTERNFRIQSFKRDNYFNDYTGQNYDFVADIKNIEPIMNFASSKQNVDIVRSNMVNKFNRFKIEYPDLELPKTFTYVFFTRPDLNLYQNTKSSILLDRVEADPVFYYLNRSEPQLIKSLTKDFTYSHDFNPFLSNKTMSFELKDEVITTAEYGQTFTGYKMKYGKHNIESKSADDFSITYRDDNNYRVYKIHKAWTDYISKVYRGEFLSKENYIKKRILDYACSVYYFLCGPDGETILFWSKYVGVFPVNTPSNSSSWQMSSGPVKMPEFTIRYEFSFKEDFNPMALYEFNANSNVYNNGRYLETSSTYDDNLFGAGNTFADAPFVQTISNTVGDYEFKLKFRKPK